MDTAVSAVSRSVPWRRKPLAVTSLTSILEPLVRACMLAASDAIDVLSRRCHVDLLSILHFGIVSSANAYDTDLDPTKDGGNTGPYRFLVINRRLS